MIHTRTKIIALIATGFFLVALSIYIGFVFMLTNHKETLLAERTAVADVTMQKQSLDALLQIVEKSTTERETMRGYILEDDRVIDLLSLIETTAAEQGASLTTSALTVNPIDDTFEELALTVSIKGSFSHIMRVLMLLEALPQQSTISTILFTKAENEDGGEWQGTVDLRVTKYKKI